MTAVDTTQDARWMRMALAEAQAAATAGEVPVGAVVVCEGQLIATGRNTPIAAHDPTAHAEINALRQAAQRRGNYRLDDCELFVTLEPCTMCAGAMLHARIRRVVFGATDPKTGASGSVSNVFAATQLNHQTQVRGGLLAEESSALLQDFFKRQRARQRLETMEAGRALRDDALRTPEHRFSALPAMPAASCYLSDLPSLSGWRLHYVDTGPADASASTLCLHDLASWSSAWRGRVAQGAARGQRVVCPDLIGFGKSDKPKKESVHTLAWHSQVLLELLERLDLRQVTLIAPEGMSALAQQLAAGAPHRILALVQDEPPALDRATRDAPYPDRGHQAAQRAFAALAARHQPGH